jgi:molybdopterin synthase catalytic subunit
VDELKKKVPIWKRPRPRTDKEDHAVYNAAVKI